MNIKGNCLGFAYRYLKWMLELMLLLVRPFNDTLSNECGLAGGIVEYMEFSGPEEHSSQTRGCRDWPWKYVTARLKLFLRLLVKMMVIVIFFIGILTSGRGSLMHFVDSVQWIIPHPLLETVLSFPTPVLLQRRIQFIRRTWGEFPPLEREDVLETTSRKVPIF